MAYNECPGDLCICNAHLVNICPRSVPVPHTRSRPAFTFRRNYLADPGRDPDAAGPLGQEEEVSGSSTPPSWYLGDIGGGVISISHTRTVTAKVAHEADAIRESNQPTQQEPGNK